MSESESVVGSKEELYPPKSVRRALNLKPGTKVRYRVEGTRLIVEPIPTVVELAERKPTVTITLEEHVGERRRLSARLEK
jgi:bifunctional DNA-binding transcriptional regulator/antitoxin component of YhaV-PrlF toxin-antitoxin module